MRFHETKLRIILFMLTAAVCASARPSQIVVVSPTIGNPVRSGDDLLAALAGMVSPSASNPWLLKIEPGVYDLGTQVLVMKPFVDIEASGQDVTLVTSAGLNTVVAASNAELRGLTVRNTNPTDATTCGSNCFAVVAPTGASAKFTDLAIVSPGPAWGISIQSGAEAILTDALVDFPIFAFAVVNRGTAIIEGTTIRVTDLASDGILNEGTLRLANSVVDAAPGTNAIVTATAGVTNVHHSTLRGQLLELFGGTINVGASQLSETGVTGAKCVVSYDAAFNPLGVNCQPIP